MTVKKNHEGIVVLLVDDDDLARAAVPTALGACGFVVITAENGQIALDTAVVTLPDIVITDLTMPVMNGYRLCSALRTHPLLMTIPIIVFSSLISQDSLDLPRFNAIFLQKPVEIATLVASIIALLHTGQASGLSSHDET
ncbi:response regulator [Paraburkholderia bannensis]|uniref:response regulator n=1 Tax=Paraburkholderia bannensis TaxID=765414 RepID=UPI000694662C|nr:response regulator [Paraburkholderia bannensis]